MVLHYRPPPAARQPLARRTHAPRAPPPPCLPPPLRLHSLQSFRPSSVPFASSLRRFPIQPHFTRTALLFLRRLWGPFLIFALFNVLCVIVYSHLEHLAWPDALFWIVHPHAIDYRAVHNSTKFFSLFVYFGVFAFQIWVAERVLVTIFSQQGREAWKAMINEAGIESIRDHVIVCGYGQVGRTVVDQLNHLKIPFVLIETNEGLYRELLKEGTLIIQGDAKRHDVLTTAGIARARGVCVLIDNDADNLYITVTARSLNSKVKIITRAGQRRYAEAIRNSGADEVIIPEYEGGLVAGRMIEKYYPFPGKLE
jgi:voltage-gated potassium channel